MGRSKAYIAHQLMIKQECEKIRKAMPVEMRKHFEDIPNTPLYQFVERIRRMQRVKDMAMMVGLALGNAFLSAMGDKPTPTVKRKRKK